MSSELLALDAPEVSPPDPSAPAPASTRGVSGGPRLVFILGALTAFGPLSIDMYLPALPTLARDFAADPSQVQLTLTGCLLGLAGGQMIGGPVSDALGRRRPLLVGVAAYALASLLCALAPSVWALIGLRFVQGLAGAIGLVIARAIVRDLHSGVAVARFFSTLMLVTGLAPILAPVIGGQLLSFTSWRGIFVLLAVIGVVLVALAALLAETLPPTNRQMGGLPATLGTFRRLLTDRHFMGYALAAGLAAAAMFSYIAGSPFVVQDIYGLSPQAFSLMFGANALGFVIVGQINGRLVGRVTPRRLLGIGLPLSTCGGVGLLLAILSGIGLVGVLPALFLMIASLGLVFPNATTMALAGHPRTAGTASALLGVLQYVIGALAAPLVGLAGINALPMALLIAALSLAALTVFSTFTRPGDMDAPRSNEVNEVL